MMMPTTLTSTTPIPVAGPYRAAQPDRPLVVLTGPQGATPHSQPPARDYGGLLWLFGGLFIFLWLVAGVRTWNRRAAMEIPAPRAMFAMHTVDTPTAVEKSDPQQSGAGPKEATLDVKLPPEVLALAKKLDGLLTAETLAALTSQVDVAKVAWVDGARTTGAIGFIAGVIATLFLVGKRNPSPSPGQPA